MQVGSARNGKVELIGHDGELKFDVKDKQLTIYAPKERPCDYAYAFKLTGFKTSLTAEAQAVRDAALKRLMQGPIDPGKAGHNNKMFGTK